MNENETRSPQYTTLGRIIYQLTVPLIVGAVCMIAIPCVLFSLTGFGQVPIDWMTREVSTRTLAIMLIVAAVVYYYLPAGRIADSVIHSLASWGCPLLQRPAPTSKSG